MSMILAKCCSKTVNNVVRCLVPRLKFDTVLNMHFRESDELMVRDITGKLEMGDWIIVRPMPVKKTIHADYELDRVVYKHGNYVCPLTGRRSYGYMFKDDYDKFSIKKDEKTIESNES